MRTFWHTVLLCTAFLVAVPLTFAQGTPAGTSGRGTGSTASTGSGSQTPPAATGSTTPSSAAPRDTGASMKDAPKSTEPAKGTAPATTGVVVHETWLNHWGILLLTAPIALVAIYFVFIRKKDAS